MLELEETVGAIGLFYRPDSVSDANRVLSELSTKAYITIAIRLRYDYNTTTTKN